MPGRMSGQQWETAPGPVDDVGHVGLEAGAGGDVVRAALQRVRGEVAGALEVGLYSVENNLLLSMDGQLWHNMTIIITNDMPKLITF